MGCSSFKGPTPIPYSVSQDDLDQCLKYKQDILDESVIVKQGTAHFIEAIPYVRESFYQFKLKESIRSINTAATMHLVNNCNESNLKKFTEIASSSQQCELSFYELNYFQALTSALKKYDWPIDVKLEGKKLALDYVKTIAKDNHMLVDRMIALSVLYEMSINNLIDYRIADRAKKYISSIQTKLLFLSEKTSANQILSCDNLDGLKEELALSRDAGIELNSILDKI